jgi:hypothetical protein
MYYNGYKLYVWVLLLVLSSLSLLASLSSTPGTWLIVKYNEWAVGGLLTVVDFGFSARILGSLVACSLIRFLINFELLVLLYSTQLNKGRR